MGPEELRRGVAAKQKYVDAPQLYGHRLHVAEQVTHEPPEERVEHPWLGLAALAHRS